MPPTADKAKGWGRFGNHTRNSHRRDSTQKDGDAKPAKAHRIIKKLHTAALTKTLVGEDQKPVPESAEPETKLAAPHQLEVAWDTVVKSVSGVKLASAPGQPGTTLSSMIQGPVISALDPYQTSKGPPAWFQELTEEHIEAFKQIFNLFDKDHGGFIDVDELYEGLKRVDSLVTREEVEAILKQGDMDKSGGITFDEFLYMMSHVDKHEPDSVVRRGPNESPKLMSLTKRVCLLYSAINRFTKDKPQTAYHLPHVLKHYTAGARLEGLTSRQLNQNLELLAGSIDEKDKDSPYSKPLNMPMDRGQKQRRHKTEGPPKRQEAWSAKEHVVVPDGISRPKTSGQQSSRKTDTKRHKGASVVVGTAQPEQNILVTVDKTAEVALKPSVCQDVSEDDVLISIQTPEGQGHFSGKEPQAEDKSLKKKSKYRRGWSWRPPKAAKDKVKSPELVIKYKHGEPTIDDLPGIRKKVQKVMDKYYDRVRQASVKRSARNWDQMCAEGMVDSIDHDWFRSVYRAYSPFDPTKVCIASQWIPTRRTQDVSCPRLVPFTF